MVARVAARARSLAERAEASDLGHRLVTRAFQRLYYREGAKTWLNTTWRGVHVTKCPLDLWVYQEIIMRERPQAIVETGTFRGGSAYFMADLFDIIGEGRVITIDLVPQDDRPEHDRITYLSGSSADPDVVAQVAALVEGLDRVMVVLDSDHHAAHVAAELEALAGFVTPGSRLVVEDTVVNGNPVHRDFGPGPLEALRPWLARHPEFSIDPECEKFAMTFNPYGWLKRAP